MTTLINFFAMRPTFTFAGIQVIWYLYLVNTVMQAYLTVSGTVQLLAQRGITVDALSPNFIPVLFGIVVQLVLVRLFLEVAAIVISRLTRATQ